MKRSIRLWETELQGKQNRVRAAARSPQPHRFVCDGLEVLGCIFLAVLTGNSRLNVSSPVTRTRYEFQGHGSRLKVDRRDSNSLATVASLKRV